LFSDLDNSTKFIGRVRHSESFDAWVDTRVIDGALLNVDQNPCLYQWICADGVNKPFQFSDDEALYVNHNCPESLVHKIRFDTTLQADNVLEYHTDDTVRTVDDSVDDQLTIKSWIGAKNPLADGETVYPLGNDDGFLFEGSEPAWSYGYHVCLAGDDLTSEFCSRPAPIDGGSGGTETNPIVSNNCGLTLEEIQYAVFAITFAGDKDDYQVGCYTYPLEFAASG